MTGKRLDVVDDGLNSGKERGSLRSNSNNPNDLAAIQDTPFHLRRVADLWKLHRKVVREAQHSQEVTPNVRSQILSRAAKAAEALITLDRRLQGIDESSVGERGPGVLVIPGKVTDAQWEDIAAGRVDTSEVPSSGPEGRKG